MNPEFDLGADAPTSAVTSPPPEGDRTSLARTIQSLMDTKPSDLLPSADQYRRIQELQRDIASLQANREAWEKRFNLQVVNNSRQAVRILELEKEIKNLEEKPGQAPGGTRYSELVEMNAAQERKLDDLREELANAQAEIDMLRGEVERAKRTPVVEHLADVEAIAAVLVNVCNLAANPR